MDMVGGSPRPFRAKNCDVVVVALSDHRLIIDELMLAEQTYKPVIPLVLESVELPEIDRVGIVALANSNQDRAQH